QLFSEPRILPPIGNSEHHCVFVKPAEKIGFQGGMNLPNVPVPNYGPPPPPDMSADTMSNNSKKGAYGGPDQWDALMGLENSPPPPYTSMVYSPPSAPPPSLPPPSFGGGGGQGMDQRPNFPLDVSAQGGNNFKESNSPKPAPRSKFEAPDTNSNFVMPDLPNVPDLPSVPHTPSHGGGGAGADTQDDIDFDDLNKRFENLKKKK
ncbi:UNVERIFIED_CONTAM: hypothetical protein GTU68_044934, partial [Idotea baltica]|nr:hypothetical protein [Idotea baltica]